MITNLLTRMIRNWVKSHHWV